jgi:hypothetical protein
MHLTSLNLALLLHSDPSAETEPINELAMEQAIKSGQLFSNNQQHLYYSGTSNNAYMTCICYNSVLSLNLLTSSAYNNLVSPAEQSFFFRVQKQNRKQKNVQVTSRCNISFGTSSRRTVWSPHIVITILEAQ